MKVDIEKRFENGAAMAAAFAHDFSTGPILAVFGPSGAGKTTMLRSIAGLERPDRGRVECFGETWFDSASGAWTPPQRRRVGYVFQEPALFPHLSVQANIAFGLAGGSAAERGRRVDEMLELLGLERFADRKPRDLSGGEAQRVVVARALAPRPRLVLLDEPFSALDTPSRRRLRTDVRQAIRQAGAAAILVTHDRTEAIAFADHVAVIVGGRVRQVGAVAEVFRKPADVDVAHSLGVESVLAARVESVVDGLVDLRIGDVRLRAVDTDALVPAPAAPSSAAGAEVFACIRAEDVTIELETPVSASARNHLPGTIVALDAEGPVERVTLDCGFLLAAAVTTNAARELGLRTGMRVVAAIKATSIHLVTR